MTNQSLVFVQCKTTLISILVSHNKLHLSLSIHSSFSNEVAQFLFCLAIKKIRAQQVHYSEIKFNWVLWSQPLMITPLLFLFSWPFAHFTSPMQSTPPTPRIIGISPMAGYLAQSFFETVRCSVITPCREPFPVCPLTSRTCHQMECLCRWHPN